MRWNLPAGLMLLGVFLLLGIGCAAPNQSAAPTPFPTAGSVTSTIPTGPTTLTISEVTNALGLYQDMPIIVTGRLERLPLLVCDSEPHPSPATWSLTDEGAVLLAAGFDQQVRQLLPEDLTMTVEGRLRRWEGPVGCSKQAQTQEVWYLDTSRILSPRTLTQATLTPSGMVEAGSTEIAQFPTDVPSEFTVTPESPEVPIEEPSPTPIEEPLLPTDAPTAPPETPPTVDPETTPIGTPTATVQAGATISGTATVTGTVTATPGPGTPTVPSGVATATTTAGQIIDRGDVLDVEGDFPSGSLGAGETHSWTVEIFEEDVYDVKVIAPLPADIVLSLWRDGEPVISRQNQAPPGTTEVISIAGQPEGTYQIRIQTEAGRSADYIMLLSVPNDYELDLRGFLAPGAPRNNINLPEEMVHYWVFTAAAGNRVTLNVTPDAQSDPYLTLFGPGAIYIDEMGDADMGQAEVMEYTVETSGLHIVTVENLEFSPMVYTILLSVQP
jgi:hypothetical protein